MSILTIVAATTAAVFLLAWLRVTAQVRSLRQQVELARYASSHDRLTGLPTRETAEHAFLYRAVHTLPGAVAILDLDHFKWVNDTYGHDTGDALLAEIAQLLTSAVQAHSGMVSWVGGDEFIVLLPGTFDDDHGSGRLTDAIGDIQAHLAVPIALASGNDTITLTVTASVGVAVFDGVHGTFATLLRHADIALYQAKRHRGCCVVHRPGMGMPPAARRHGPRLRDQHPARRHGQPSASPDGRGQRD